MSRRSGVPIERTAAGRYDAGPDLTAANGTVALARPPVARRLAATMNAARLATRNGGPGVQAGELHALGLLHDVFHHLIERYEAEARPGAFRDALAAVAADRGAEAAQRLLVAFNESFPGSPRARDEALEELLLTWLANSNPAAEPLRELVDDRQLAAATAYEDALRTMADFFAREPAFGPDRQTLVELLRAPALASPTSLAGQLRYVRDRWGTLVGELMDRLLVALDVIAEEERALHVRFGGGGGGGGGFGGRVDLPSFGGLEEEPERFSTDSDWMPRLVLLAKSTYVWLDQLSRRHGRDIRTLDGVPDEELDRIASWGVTGLWLIGLWERSKASERIKRMRGNADAVASAYSLDDYRIADDLGGEWAYEQLKARAWQRGIRMASDMVPNHMGIDSRWVVEHPDWFLSLPDPPYPAYTFTGADLSSDDRVGIFLEDHYWNDSDAAVVFKRLDRRSGESRYVYHGNDGTSFPWNDTAQLDFLKAEVREQVIRTILDVARRSPVIRFDAAMVLAKRHVRRLWYPEPGSGGAIPSRAEHGSMAASEFNRLMPTEFWRDVVDRVAAEVPDTLLLAEAFWMLEGYFVRTLGMHRVYNSAFMHMLRDEDNAGYRKLIRETLDFDPEILKRYVNFMSNPDEATAVEQFGKGDKYVGVATVMATLPGLPMLGHGQVEGFGEKYGMEFRRATLDEQPDRWLVERHEREIFPLLHRRGWFAEAADFRLYDFETDGGGVDENVFAYSNGSGQTRSLVVYHNRFGSTAGRIRMSVPSKGAAAQAIVEALGLGHLRDDGLVAFRDAAAGGAESLRTVAELRDGLSLRLDAYARRVFWEFREVADVSGVWRRLHGRLGGRGVPSLDDALREQELEPVHAALRAALARDADEALVRAFVGAIAEATGTASGPIDSVVDVIGRRVRAARDRRDLDSWRRALVHGWSLLEPLGALAPKAMVGPTSRAWFDELRLAPVVAAGLRSDDVDEAGAWAAVARVHMLLAFARPSNVKGRSAAERARRAALAWLDDPDTRAFLRVNRWQDEEWLDGDAWRELVACASLLDGIDAAATSRRASTTGRLPFDHLAGVAEAAGYRVAAVRDSLRGFSQPPPDRPARTARAGSGPGRPRQAGTN